MAPRAAPCCLLPSHSPRLPDPASSKEAGELSAPRRAAVGVVRGRGNALPAAARPCVPRRVSVLVPRRLPLAFTPSLDHPARSGPFEPRSQIAVCGRPALSACLLFAKAGPNPLREARLPARTAVLQRWRARRSESASCSRWSEGLRAALRSQNLCLPVPPLPPPLFFREVAAFWLCEHSLTCIS